jgi:hypothetical protein
MIHKTLNRKFRTEQHKTRTHTQNEGKLG